MLPHQIRTVFLSWFLPHHVRRFDKEGFTHLNHCKVLLSHSGIINKFCLPMRISVKCIQSSWLFECKAYCMYFLNLFMDLCLELSAAFLNECAFFMFASLCASVSCRVRAHAECGARYLTKTRCLLYYQH